MKAVIILVTFNGMTWLPRTLASLPEKYTTVVVDNYSNDGSVEFIKTNYPNIKLLVQQENLGFGQANNVGIRYALDQNAQHIFLLNQDAYIIDDVLEKLVQFQSTNTSYGIVSPMHLNSDQNKLDEKFHGFLAESPNYSNDFNLDFANSPKVIYDVPFVNAAAWLISRRCIETVGGFDPLFFHYGEDENYCQRVNFHGLKTAVISNTFIVHDRQHRERKEIIPFTDYYFSRRKSHYCKNYANINDGDGLQKLNFKIKYLRRQAIKSALQSKAGRLKGLIIELRLLNEVRPKILSSRKTNSTTGLHYLETS